MMYERERVAEASEKIAAAIARRAFVDWFVKHAGEWRIQAAVALPGPSAN